MNDYLGSLQYSPVQTLEEIVAFNRGYQFCQLPPGQLRQSHKTSN